MNKTATFNGINKNYYHFWFWDFYKPETNFSGLRPPANLEDWYIPSGFLHQ